MTRIDLCKACTTVVESTPETIMYEVLEYEIVEVGTVVDFTVPSGEVKWWEVTLPPLDEDDVREED